MAEHVLNLQIAAGASLTITSREITGLTDRERMAH